MHESIWDAIRQTPPAPGPIGYMCSYVNQSDDVHNSGFAGAFRQLWHGPLRPEHLQDHDSGCKGMTWQIELFLAAAVIAIALLIAMSLPESENAHD